MESDQRSGEPSPKTSMVYNSKANHAFPAFECEMKKVAYTGEDLRLL